jgi:hypothetical protein
MKKNYMKPTMRVVKMQHRQHILAGSGPFGAKGVSNSENINWKDGGFADGEDDY